MASSRWAFFTSRACAILGAILIAAGAAGILGGVMSPWVQIKVFKNIDVSIPGLFFAPGGLCLAVATLVLLRMRRSPLLCLIAACFVLNWTTEARKSVPFFVRHQVIGASLALSPINRLLDQFHINDIEIITNGAIPNAQLIGPGLEWTTWGGSALLLGGALGIPADPSVVWLWTRTARARCRSCGTRWPLRRNAQFCPECGTPTHPISQRVCLNCHTPASKGDYHCVQCGSLLPSAPTLS